MCINIHSLFIMHVEFNLADEGTENNNANNNMVL